MGTIDKKCTKCNEVKLLIDFYADKSKKDGYRTTCKICHHEKVMIWQQNNKEKVRGYYNKWYEANPEKVHENSAKVYRDHREKEQKRLAVWEQNNKKKRKIAKEKWVKENSEMLKQKSSMWAKNNRGKRNAVESKRRATKLNATPKWLTNEHLKAIEMFYIIASKLTEQTRISHEVDHIVPLQGKTVNGLHVPWNLRVVTSEINRKKYNKIIEL